MLVNKNKSKRKTNNIERKISNNIQSMRSWIRKIEQSTNSVSSRLSAVEKRISNRTNGNSKKDLSGFTIIDGSIDSFIDKLKDEKEEKNFEYIFRVFDSELAMIMEDIDTQESEIEKLKEHINQIRNLIEKTNDGLLKTRDISKKHIINLNERIENLERKAPPTMKIGKMQIPIEISGITAGSIALFAALMVGINKTEIITSPLFLAFAGIVFFGTTVFKTIKSRNITNNS